MISFKDLCLSRQATRTFVSKDIEPGKIQYILECARLAPSAVNYQPWKLYVLQSEDAKAKVLECYNREWVKEAPAFILCTVLHDKEWIRASDGKPHGNIDIAILAEHICLAAAEQGLGTCWVCNFDASKIVKLFGLDPSEEPAVLIPIGYSNEPVRPKTRKTPDEFVTVI